MSLRKKGKLPPTGSSGNGVSRVATMSDKDPGVSASRVAPVLFDYYTVPIRETWTHRAISHPKY